MSPGTVTLTALQFTIKMGDFQQEPHICEEEKEPRQLIAANGTDAKTEEEKKEEVLQPVKDADQTDWSELLDQSLKSSTHAVHNSDIEQQLDDMENKQAAYEALEAEQSQHTLSLEFADLAMVNMQRGGRKPDA